MYGCLNKVVSELYIFFGIYNEMENMVVVVMFFFNWFKSLKGLILKVFEFIY